MGWRWNGEVEVEVKIASTTRKEKTSREKTSGRNHFFFLCWGLFSIVETWDGFVVGMKAEAERARKGGAGVDETPPQFTESMMAVGVTDWRWPWRWRCGCQFCFSRRATGGGWDWVERINFHLRWLKSSTYGYDSFYFFLIFLLFRWNYKILTLFIIHGIRPPAMIAHGDKLIIHIKWT